MCVFKSLSIFPYEDLVNLFLLYLKKNNYYDLNKDILSEVKIPKNRK